MNNVDSLYIHFPFCRHLCNYCDFYKHKLVNENQVLDFQNYLLKNIESNEEYLSANNYELSKLSTLYIGGGTPSLWGFNGAEFIKNNILDRYTLSDNYEFTIEVDPDSWSEKEIHNWMKIGVNRFSIGAQSFDPSYISIMDRGHTKEQVIELISFLKSINANYSVDIMLGLPALEEKRAVETEILELINYNPSHFSVYILKTRSNYTHKAILPDDDTTSEEYLKVCKLLEKEGFKQYEVSNFARDNRVSRHNLKYWSCDSVAALGSNATGILNLGEIAKRYQWKSSGEGLKEEVLTTDEFLLEKVYMRLRSELGFNFKEYDREKIDRVFKRWRELNYIKSIDDYHIKLNSKGYLMLDSLISDLFSFNLL